MQSGGTRTKESVPANVDYFYNRWTKHGSRLYGVATFFSLISAGILDIPVQAAYTEGFINNCAARVCTDQFVRSDQRDSNGNPTGRWLYHGGDNAIHDDANIQQDLFELTNYYKLAVDPPSRSDVAGLFRNVNNWVSQTNSPQFIGGFPNFQQASGNLRGTVSINANGAVWRDIPERELGDISSDAKKIAAVDEWAKGHGYAGGLPTFNQARNFNGENVHGAILLKTGLLERRVIDREKDLKNKFEDLEALFRSVDNYASSQGFAAGYPSMRWTGRGDKIEVVLIKNIGIEKQDVALSNLVNPPQTPYITITPENNSYFQWMFQNVNTWVNVNHKNYFVGGFPNFQARDYLRGTLSVGRNAAEFKDIPMQELGDISSTHKLIAAVDLWARQRGFAGGLPTFHQARYNGVEVRGAILIKPNSAERRLVSQNELNNFEDLEGLFRAVDEYANKNGFRAGYPSLRKVGNQGTIEVVLMRKDSVAWNDVSLNDIKSHASNVVYRTPQVGDPGYIATSKGGTDGVIVTRREINPPQPIVSSINPPPSTFGLTEDQVLERLESIPIFTITDEKGSPMLGAVPQQPNTAPDDSQLLFFFLGQDEAQNMLAQVQRSNPAVGSRAQIIVRSMKDAYKVIRENRDKKVKFQFIPAKTSIDSARMLLSSQGVGADKVPNVPVFFAIGGQGNTQGLLTMLIDIKGRKEQAVPFFLDLQDLQDLLNRASKDQPQVTGATKIQVTSLFQVLDSMVSKDNSKAEVERFQFVPSRSSFEYILRNSPQK